MSKQVSRAKHRSGELTYAVRQLDETLKRIESLGKDVLGVLAQTNVELNRAASANASETSGTRLNGRSMRSENITPRGEMDLMREDIITYQEVRGLIPTHPSASTVSRWCKNGSRGLKLESIMIGGRRKTTRQAVERFLAACRDQHWIGIDANTAAALEQALADKGYFVTPKKHGHTSRVAPKQLIKLPRKSRSRDASAGAHKRGSATAGNSTVNETECKRD